MYLRPSPNDVLTVVANITTNRVQHTEIVQYLQVTIAMLVIKQPSNVHDDPLSLNTDLGVAYVLWTLNVIYRFFAVLLAFSNFAKSL